MKYGRSVGAVGLLVLGMAAGCAGDPLVGTWQASEQILGLSVLVRMTVSGDGTLVTDTTTTYLPGSALYPGCMVAVHETGATYVEAHTSTSTGSSSMTVTVTPAATHMGTQTRTGCTHASDDVTDAPLDNEGQANTAGASTFAYTIDGNTLTLTQVGASGTTATQTFTRQ